MRVRWTIEESLAPLHLGETSGAEARRRALLARGTGRFDSESLKRSISARSDQSAISGWRRWASSSPATNDAFGIGPCLGFLGFEGREDGISGAVHFT